MDRRVLIIATAATLALAGCEKRSKLYCGKNPEDLANCDQLDAPPPPPVMCTMDNQCDPPHCELGANICVECLDNSHCLPEQRCDVGGSYTCRACIADMDCAGGACLPGGSCGGDDTVIYVEPGGTNNPTCGFATPCASITHAITLVSAARKYVHLTGELTESVTIKGKTVEIIAEPDAKLTGNVAIDWAVKIEASIVKVYGLEVYCPPGADQNGFLLTGAHTTTLDGVEVHGCGRDAGIDIHMGVTRISRSNIHDNPAGGIKSDGSALFSITNNWIHHNGGGMVGGIKLGNDKVVDQRVEFNTIVDNQVGGLSCKNAFAAPNNIIGGNGTALADNVTTCNADGSLVTDDLVPLAFVDRANGDYHITMNSTAKDNAITASTISDDIDRDLRPQDAGKDFGADEYKP